MAFLSNVLGVEIESRRLDELPEDQFTIREHPRHAGYNAWTRLVYSRLAVPMLLDTGSTEGALMEEVVMAIIAETIRAYTAKELDQKSELYPVTRI